MVACLYAQICRQNDKSLHVRIHHPVSISVTWYEYNMKYNRLL